ncbi:MAG: hypothetical protein ACI3ZO_08045 [Candidatus Cryptobacteroides sp.]
MRRIISILAMLTIGVGAYGQAQITTKKEKVKDFEVRTMKVVLTGNDFIDPAFKEAVKNTWTLSPFEFCTMDEFNRTMTSEEYYFLVPVKAQYKKEVFPGIRMLSLVKGRKGAKSIDDMLEVVSIPMCSADVPSGRETAMLPGIMDIIQSYVRKSLSSRFSSIKSTVRKKPGGCKVYFAGSEISEALGEEALDKLRRKGARIVDDGEADSIFIEGMPGTAVSYLIAPEWPEKGSVCWKMVIDSRTHDLYLLKKQTLSGASDKGFQKSEISKFSSR